MELYNETPKFKWWRYPAAVLVFLAIFILWPLVVFLVYSFFATFTPDAYQAGPLWMWIVSYALGTSFAFEQMEKLLLSQKRAFQVVWSISIGLYAITNSIYNFMYRGINGGVGFIVVCIVSIYYTVQYCKELSL